MNRSQGVVIAGLCALAILVAVWVLPHRTKSETQVNGPKSAETIAKTKTSPGVIAEQQPADMLLTDGPMFEQGVAMGILTMETEIELETPMEQEAVQYARVTANMSIAQMAELQTLRRGEIVRDVSGRLILAYMEKEQCEDTSNCKIIVVSSRSGKTVWDGDWVKGYTETGIGKEVVRVK